MERQNNGCLVEFRYLRSSNSRRKERREEKFEVLTPETDCSVGN